MANQVRSGGTQKTTISGANDNIRRGNRVIRDIYDLSINEYLFKDQSIPADKIVGDISGGGNNIGTDVIQSFPGLVAYWAGTINRNTLVLKDMTSNGIDLTRNGNATISRFSLAPMLGFLDSYWTFADDARLDLSGNESPFSSSGTPGTDLMGGITLLAWVRLTQVDSNRAIIAKWSESSQRSYVLDYRLTNSVLRFGISSNGTTEAFVSSSNNAIVQDTWHLVVGRFTRANEIATFVDGVKTTAATAVTSVFNSTSQFRLGEPGVSDDSGWIGNMIYPIVVAASLPDDMIEDYRQRTIWLFE